MLPTTSLPSPPPPPPPSSSSSAAIRGINQPSRRRRRQVGGSGSTTRDSAQMVADYGDGASASAAAATSAGAGLDGMGGSGGVGGGGLDGGSGGGGGGAFYAQDLESGMGLCEDLDRTGGYDDNNGGSGQHQMHIVQTAPLSSPPGVELSGRRSRRSPPSSSQRVAAAGGPSSVPYGARFSDSTPDDPYYVAPTREFLLSDYMVRDREYQEFLLYGNRGGRASGGDGISGRDVARGCVGMSFVGMMFLLFVGFLIEWQPLYIKGIDYNAGFATNSGGGANGSGNGGGGGGNANWSYRGNDSGGGQQSYRTKSKQPLRKESSNAFKAAAAYFLTTVLSLICVQNYDQMGGVGGVVDLSIPPRWRRLFHVRQNCAIAYHRYRRRQYVDIPDAATAPTLPLFRDSAGGGTTRRRRGGHGHGHGHGQPRNATLDLWNRVANTVGGMTSPMRKRRDAKTKHV